MARMIGDAMSTRTMSPVVARSRLRILGLSIAGLLVCAVLLGSVFAGGAQAARSYNAQEIAFVNSLNQYRAANGLQPLLLSDAISEASYRHNHDMAKYKFFSHYSVRSDWFASNATPWTRMAASGYSYNTNKGENIAAGQSTAALVMGAWKASSGHRRQHAELRLQGHRGQLLHNSPALLTPTTGRPTSADTSIRPLTPSVRRRLRPRRATSRTIPVFVYSGTWYTFSTSGASGGSYRRANAGSASVTVTFTGTYLAWIATTGTTLSKAYVSLDGGPAQSVDLARSAVAYQQKVWNTGTLASGMHTVKIWRNPSDAAGKYISVDAFDIMGTLN